MEDMELALREFVKGFYIPNPVNITFTQKQIVDGFKIDDLVSERNFRYFKNMLNRKVFGNSYSRYGKCLGMLVVREVSSNQRHHLHTIIQQPPTLTHQQFDQVVMECWGKTLFGYEEIHINHPSEKDGWLGYMMKKKTKSNLMDGVDWENSHPVDPCRI